MTKGNVKKISTHALLLTVVASAVWLFMVLWENMTRFIKKGLADSKAIRVAEKTSCAVSQNDEPHFSGCNSIL